VAAAQLKRVGFELDPGYLAVALERLSSLGLKPDCGADYEVLHSRRTVSQLTPRGWTGLKDDQLCDLAIRQELVLVTNNTRDFRKLMGAVELHAGLIVGSGLGTSHS
jgi:Domain of unknown function (DUF5615)